jgi:hypothetical protein
MQGNGDQPIGGELFRTPVIGQHVAKRFGQAGQALVLKTMDALAQWALKQRDRSDLFDLKRLRPTVGTQSIGYKWLAALFAQRRCERHNACLTRVTPQAAWRTAAAALRRKQKVGEANPGLPSPLLKLNDATPTGLRRHISLAG